MKFIKTNTNGHPFMVGDSHNITTGIKLESTSIEKPKTIVIEVFKIATPTVL